MFEGVVSQVIAGYLGRFVKGIQKDQLKIGIWNEEILLEKVELILEAFDYLQLPFALKDGRVGKLSIRIPWKKLGWDPIIVVLENIFICACQREDNEWTSASVEKRELAGKLAKLNTIELAKLSRRVSDDQAGQSFISYISAKILDNIQVSIRNVHIVYIDSHKNQESFVFGLKLSSLTILTDPQKQNFIGSLSGKPKSGQVRKIIEISTVGLYCNLVGESHRLFSLTDAQLGSNVMLDNEKYDYMINPLDLMISLLVCKSGKLDGSPLYDINVEITNLILTVNEIQLQQVLSLWDYFSICDLRKKYGRYRPPQTSLLLKIQGWQKMWWHYAQNSALADVRQKSRTSLSNFGKRIIHCLKYVKLYKRKLELLQQDQVVNKDILQELERMDKECDIDDILNYRSLAEQQLQESLLKLAASDGAKSTQEKNHNGDQTSSKARSWLNWLSLGMLGAGGTSDTGSFAGVVSDEIIKDIYEATEFHPVLLSGDSSLRSRSCLSSVKLNVCQIVISFVTKIPGWTTAKVICSEFIVEGKVWDDSAAIHGSIDTVKMVDAGNVNLILINKVEKSLTMSRLPFLSVHVNMPHSDQNNDVSTMIALQPFEASFGIDLLLFIQHFSRVITSIQFQQDRVLSSLNRMNSFEARLLKKVEHYLYNHKKMYWEVTLDNTILNLPLQNEKLKVLNMVLEFEAFSFKSKPQAESSQISDRRFHWESCCAKNPISGIPINFQIGDLFNDFDIKLDGFKVNLLEPKASRLVQVIENCNASFDAKLCIMDEPSFKMFEVDCFVPILAMHFSPEIFCALLSIKDLLSVLESQVFEGDPCVADNSAHDPHSFPFSVSVKLDNWQCNVHLEDDAKNGAIVSFTFGDTDFRYSREEAMKLLFLANIFTVDYFHSEDGSHCNILCSTRNEVGGAINESVKHFDLSFPEMYSSRNPGNGCLELHYQAPLAGCLIQQESSLFLNDVDLHIHPKIFSLLQRFCGELSMLSSFGSSFVKSSRLNENIIGVEMADSAFNMIGFSNFYNVDQAVSSKGSLDNFPFVSILNSGCLNNFDGSMMLGVSELKKMSVKENECSKCLDFWQRSRLVKGSNMQLPSYSNVESCTNSNNSFSTEFSLNRVRVVFHDSSCILGILMVPTSISCLRYCQTDSWDLQSSIQGLTLSSSWSSPSIQEVLWGPSSASISPVLNIHIRKEKKRNMLPVTEISIGIQHVCCILSSDFLSLLIGYFSLPDWIPRHYHHEIMEFENSQNTQDELMYKFEVLDSILLLPLENHDYCMQLELPQLISSFIPMIRSADAFRGIPSDCIISESPFAETVKIVNVFGRNTSLSLLLFRDDKTFMLKRDECMSNARIVIIENLDADLWIQIPCSTKEFQTSIMHSLIMMNVSICNIIARDDYFISAVEALTNVIDQFTLVTEKSKMYTSDVLQFLGCKTNIRKDVSFDTANDSLVSVRCCTKMLSVSFCQFKLENTPHALVAKAEMQLNVSAKMRKEVLQSLDLNIPSLVLRSSFSNILLVSLTPEVASSTSLCLNLSTCGVESELLFTIAYLDVWLHFRDWNNIIKLLMSYTKDLEGSSASSGANPELGYHIGQDSMNASWIIKSENISVSLHIPSSTDIELRDAEMIDVDMFNTTEVTGHNLAENMPPFKSKNCKFLKITIHSKTCEVIFADNIVKLKLTLDKMRVMLEMVLSSKITSIPFMNVSHIRIAISTSRVQGKPIDMSSEVTVDSFDIGISYQVLYFCSCFQLNLSEAASSPISRNSIAFKVHLKKGSLLLSDGRWNYHGPILETLMKNMIVQFKQADDIVEGLIIADLLVNYNNIDKVMWEPFLEPWSFELNLTRKYEGHILNRYAIADVYLKSTKQLNLNITEPLIEAFFRLCNTVIDAYKHDDVYNFRETVSGFQTIEDIHSRRYAPYILHNETSLPLTYHVQHGAADMDNVHNFHMNNQNIVQPGFSVPIYVEETLDEEVFQRRSSNSSERLIEKKMNGISHHMISIHFEGTSGPSRPMSMDLVGLSFFEVNFSKNKHSVPVESDNDSRALGYNLRTEEQFKSDQHDGLVVPVVFEVSMQHYSKIIRLYSTVILFNATSVPMELRFDIPLGVSSKVLGPILPGNEIPLPLHLAESGQIRWHPAGTHYLWSEVHSLANILSQENRLGYMRSFVCYPSHPSSDPFRCCISIQDYSLCSAGGAENHSSINIHEREPPNLRSNKSIFPRKHCIRHVRLNTPLLVKNYLPKCLTLTIECGGVAHSLSLSEVGTTSVCHCDSTHDLGFTFEMKGFHHISSKFPRAESFSAMGRLIGSVYSSSEKLTFYPEELSGLICVTLDKTMDASCGAREICLSVPFFLYNCTGLFLTILDVNNEGKGSALVIPSSYHEIEQKQQLALKDGLALVSTESNAYSDPDLSGSSLEIGKLDYMFAKADHNQPSLSQTNNPDGTELPYSSAIESTIGWSPSYLSGEAVKLNDYSHDGSSSKAKPFIYGPVVHIPANDLMVKLSASLSKARPDTNHSQSWSRPFSLIPASGSTNIVIPQPFASGAFLISSTSVPVSGDLSGRTRAITFQPRYVICNACNKDLFFRQKGTNISHHLIVGQHSHLHWTDTSRELLISLRFNEPGWQWSGNFRPECLGDAQVKMRNYITGISNMVRVEVQNADVPLSKDNVIKNSSGHPMTHLILLSDDNTGFMPYRIDNFSMETLRIYQQKCESCDTTVHPYSSYPYSWDEPCYLHRLVIEVPGERILGAYSLDDIKEYEPVWLPPTSEKPGRRLHISVHSEGAVKVLSVIDSNYHLINDNKGGIFLGVRDEKVVDQKMNSNAGFTEVFTIHVPFLGISLMNSTPQELVFTCAKETTVVLMQSLNQQKISFKTFTLQIDNQLPDTPYPIMLSFDKESRGRSTNILRSRENNTVEPIFYFSASKWRNMDKSLLSFESVEIGLAPLCIELEEQILLTLIEYFRAISSRLQSRRMGKNFELGNQSCSSDGILRSAQGYNGRNVLTENEFVGTHERCELLPSVFPVGAPWQQIFLLARRKKKIYVEVFELAPLTLSLSFSSIPWMRRNESSANMDSLAPIHSTTLQRGLMALVDVEGVPVHFTQLTLTHIMASPESIREIVSRHYMRQLFHEMYKVLGSAGVIGNPMGFARNIGSGIRDFLSFTNKGVLQSPSGLLTSVAQGSRGLLNSTVYAISSATSQFSKAAHKGIVAFTFDQLGASELEEQQNHLEHGKGVLNEFLEGLTGLLQFPVRGAEKHGLPGVVSGIALGTAGLIARPVASILEATGKTAQSIRNRSSPHQSSHFRTRLPRPLARGLPLTPYSWDEAIGVSMLLQADGSRLKDEIFVTCKLLKQAGRFVTISKRLVLVSWCSCLLGLGSPVFVGIPPNPEWVIETEMSLESVVHIDRVEEVVNIVGSYPETVSKQKRGSTRNRPWTPLTSVPVFHMNVELPNNEEAEDTLQVLLTTIDDGKSCRWGKHILQRSNLK